MQLTTKRLIAATAILGVMIMAGLAMRPDPLLVDTATVSRGTLETAIDADGHTRVRDRFVVVAPVGGRLVRMTVVEGALVRAGDVVARIAPLPLDPSMALQARARLDAASALVSVATGQSRAADVMLDQRRRELSRARRLAEVGGVAPRVVEECEVALADAEAAASGAKERVLAAEADVRHARATLAGDPSVGGAMVLTRAPVAGRVLRVAERSERIVAPGSPIVEIGDPRAVEIVVDVLSSDAGAIAPGDEVRLTGWAADNGDGDGPAMSGRVREIEPAAFVKLSALGVEERRVNVIVDLVNASAVMGDGFRVDARIVVWSGASVLRVPSSALVRAGADATEGWLAFVVRDGRIVRRPVRIGHSGDAAAEVVDGLAEGDVVVVFPSDRVQEGMRVKAR